MTQLAVTTETDFGVDTPVTAGGFDPPVVPPDEPVVPVDPEPPEMLAGVDEPPPHPTSMTTSATVDARCNHFLNDIQRSQYVCDAAKSVVRRLRAMRPPEHGAREVCATADFAESMSCSQGRCSKCEDRQEWWGVGALIRK